MKKKIERKEERIAAIRSEAARHRGVYAEGRTRKRLGKRLRMQRHGGTQQQRERTLRP